MPPDDVDTVVNEPPAFKGLATTDDANQNVVIPLEPIPDGATGFGHVLGILWAKIDVVSESHEYATPTSGSTKLKSATAGPAKIHWQEAGTGEKWALVILGLNEVTVYEFRLCTDTLATLYLDNAEIGEHDPDEVAIIEQNGVVDCWQLIGPAPQCKTGQCAVIRGWKDECFSCYALTPCGGGTATIVRERQCGEWAQYAGRVVKLDGPGHEGCYEVAKASGCFGVNEELGVEHIVDVYENCDGCGCYELENCEDDEDVVYVSGDLATVVGQTSGVDSIGERVKYRGVCYTITGFANPCGTTPQVWNVDEVERVESCAACCYLLTPCEGQEGDPEPFYLKLHSTDTTNPEDFLNGSVSNGRVIMLFSNLCYTWSVPEACDPEEVIIGLQDVREEFDSCEDCKITCWKECGTTTYIRTYNDMKEVGPGAAVKRAEDGKCYVRENDAGTCGTPTIVPFTIQAIIDEGEDSCTICQTPKVKLTPDCGSGCGDCSGSSSGGSGSGAATIVTDNAAFFEHVGKFIKMDGVCRFVEWTTDALAGEVGCWTGPFDSCEACRAAPSQLKVYARVGDTDKIVTIEGEFNVCGEEEVPECEE